MKKLSINPELRDFIPPLSGEEKKSLEDSLLKYGYKGAPIYIWHDYIVDGHNRYNLCQKHNIEFPIEELDLGADATIIDVMGWMINIQLGRRNLSPQQRIAVVKKFEKKIREQAKQNQSKGGRFSKKDFSNGKTLIEKKIRTDKELAKLAGVGTGTIARFNRVMSSDDEELKKKLLSDEVKINTAYEKVREKEKPKENISNKTNQITPRTYQDNVLDFIVPKQEFDIMTNTLLEKITSCDYRIFDLHEVYKKMENEDIDYAITKFDGVIETIMKLEEKIKEYVKKTKQYKKHKNGLIVPDSTEVLPCKILHAKLDCQKTPKETDIRELASNWEDKLCDPIHVSYRDGQYGIVEGQKRKLAKMMIDSEETLICHIYRGLTEMDEYQLFSQLNNDNRTYGSNEDYEARSKFDPKWKYILECVGKVGFSVVYSGGAKEKTFGCAATLEEIYDDMGDIDFIEMIKLLSEICEGIRFSLQATFLKGFAKFYSIYKTSIINIEFKKMFFDKNTKKITKKAFINVAEKSETYAQTKNVGVKSAFGILMLYNECCSKKNRLSLGAFDSLDK